MDRRTLWRRLAQRPNAVRFDDLARLLKLAGFDHVHTRGSHHIYKRADVRLSVPYRRPHVLPVYVKEVLALTKEEGDDG